MGISLLNFPRLPLLFPHFPSTFTRQFECFGPRNAFEHLHYSYFVHEPFTGYKYTICITNYSQYTELSSTKSEKAMPIRIFLIFFASTLSCLRLSTKKKEKTTATAEFDLPREITCVEFLRRQMRMCDGFNV